jgi:ABC-2 type transport system permease protein
MILLHKLKKYIAIMRINMLNKLMYMGDVLSEAPAIALRIMLLTQLYQYIGTSGTMAGLTITQIVWMLFIANLVESISWYIATVISKEVQSGTVVYALTRPYSYIWYQFAYMIGMILPSFCINVVLVSPLVLLLVGIPPCSFISLISGTLIMAGSIILTFLILFCIGISAFWIEETRGLMWLYYHAHMLLGGLLIPIALLPKLLQQFVILSPFGNLFAGATRILFAYDQHVFYQTLVSQWLWIIIMWYLAVFLFNRGMRAVAAQGG